MTTTTTTTTTTTNSSSSITTNTTITATTYTATNTNNNIIIIILIIIKLLLFLLFSISKKPIIMINVLREPLDQLISVYSWKRFGDATNDFKGPTATNSTMVTTLLLLFGT